jgi:hypothetical protein
MLQKNVSCWLRGLIIVALVVGLAVFFVIVPLVGTELRRTYPEFQARLWPWLIFLWCFSVPCFWSLVPGWQLFGRVGGNSAFCRENALCLKTISQLLLADGAFFFAGNVAYWLLNLSHPSVLIASLFVSLALLAIGIAAAVLEGLVERAAALREDSELTI